MKKGALAVAAGLAIGAVGASLGVPSAAGPAGQDAAPSGGPGRPGAAPSGPSTAGSGAAGTGMAAGAAPIAGAEWIAVPSGWRPLPGMVPEGQAGSGAVQVESRQGVGDPALGCFALLQRVSAPVRGFDGERAYAAVVRELETAGFTAGPAGAQMPFQGRGVRGRVRTIIAGRTADRVTVLSAACFYNDREPDRCRPMCDAMLDSAGVRP